MMMKSKKQEAVERKQTGKYNCAQAVACSFCEYTELDEQTMHHATLGLGLGIGGMEGTCGALTGAAVVIGFAAKENKPKAMRMSRTLMAKFQERNGATQCRIIKGADTGKVLRTCDDCVADAAEFLDEILQSDTAE